MGELSDLYQEVILDHNRKPRNFGSLSGADHRAEGYNPLCGDRMTVYLKLQGDRIEEISFEGSGCAISKASSSIMTTVLKGKTTSEGLKLFDQFHAMVTGKKTATDVQKLSVFAGVSEFPARVKCATLAWHTFRAALDDKKETISTEDEGGGK